jgi:iron uptake system component EfeO
VKTPLRWTATAGAAALLLTGCVANQPAGDGPASVLTVTANADSCAISANTTASGKTTFRVANAGEATTEFYLLAADRLRIVAEKEDLAPGAFAELTVTLAAGKYFTACKPGGEKVGEAEFTVIG